MPRIIAGSAKGRKIGAPEGTATRPTSDRAREALFSALNSQLTSWAGRRFLDLYAGSGAVGLEAASRGASAVVLVESHAPALTALRSNIALLGFTSTSVVASSVERFAQLPAEPFDVIFADPPYDTGSSAVQSALENLLANGAAKAGTIVVVERSKRDTTWTWPEPITGLRNKSYGEATFWYGQVD